LSFFTLNSEITSGFSVYLGPFTGDGVVGTTLGSLGFTLEIAFFSSFFATFLESVEILVEDFGSATILV
jgi:hypothetical protein